MYRHILCIVCLILAAACRNSAEREPVQVVDLLREMDRADKRPSGGFALAVHRERDDVRAAVVAPVPSRLTIPLPLPRRGVLRASVALDADDPGTAVRFRVGVSDHRIYEALDEIVVTADRRGWVDLHTDLSAYAGFKWSLFYRPDRVIWRLVLAADAISGAARAVWGTPEIVTDPPSANEYVARRGRLR